MEVTPLKLAVVASGRMQKEIALAAGLDPAQMSRIVNGLRCDQRTRQAIADAIGLDVGDLWPGHGDASDHNPVRPGPSSEEIAA